MKDGLNVESLLWPLGATWVDHWAEERLYDLEWGTVVRIRIVGPKRAKVLSVDLVACKSDRRLRLK